MTWWNFACTVAILLLDNTWKQWKASSIQIPCESMNSLRGSALRSDWPWLGNLDKADVEIPAWKGLRRSLRSGPCACRELCPKSHPSSIFKLTRAFVLLSPLFWKHLDQTLKMLLVFATRYLHVFQVNKWSNRTYDSLISLYTSLEFLWQQKGKTHWTKALYKMWSWNLMSIRS